MDAVLEKSEFRQPKRLRGLQPTLIRQFFERALPDSINFGLGEPDLPTPDFMREEAARIAVEEQNGYTSHPGLPCRHSRRRTTSAPSFLRRCSRGHRSGARGRELQV